MYVSTKCLSDKWFLSKIRITPFVQNGTTHRYVMHESKLREGNSDKVERTFFLML
jgi:hypothetical protein